MVAFAWPPLGTWPTTQACTLTGSQTSDPLVCSPRSIHWATPARVSWQILLIPFCHVILHIHRFQGLGCIQHFGSLNTIKCFYILYLHELQIHENYTCQLFHYLVDIFHIFKTGKWDSFKWRIWYQDSRDQIKDSVVSLFVLQVIQCWLPFKKHYNLF